MGEYAMFQGGEIKIGTCESMYYLRADQRGMVQAISGNVNPNGKDALSIRFRFPFPDEDGMQPGSFEDFDRALTVPNYPVPEGVEHYTIQFSNPKGYLLSLPCPEGPGPHAVKVHRNGFGGAVKLQQQKLLADGRLVPVLCCGGCGALWRMEDESEIVELAQRFIDEGERRRNDSWLDSGEKVGHQFWHKIAARILSGAKLPTELATA